MFGIENNIDEKIDQMSKMFWTKFDNVMNEIDPKRILTKSGNDYIYCMPIPGFAKENISVKNHKEAKGIKITGTVKDAFTGAERTLDHSYTYPKGLSLRSVKCSNGLLYIFFEDMNKSTNAEEVKIED